MVYLALFPGAHPAHHTARAHNHTANNEKLVEGRETWLWFTHNRGYYVVVERHSAVVTDVLRFVGLTHGRVEIFINLSNRPCQSSSGPSGPSDQWT